MASVEVFLCGDMIDHRRQEEKWQSGKATSTLVPSLITCVASFKHLVPALHLSFSVYKNDSHAAYLAGLQGMLEFIYVKCLALITFRSCATQQLRLGSERPYA